MLRFVGEVVVLGGGQVNPNWHMIAVVEPLIRRTYFAVIDHPATAMKYIVDVIRLGSVAVQEKAGVKFCALIGFVGLMIRAVKSMVVQDLYCAAMIPSPLGAVPDATAVHVA